MRITHPSTVRHLMSRILSVILCCRGGKELNNCVKEGAIYCAELKKKKKFEVQKAVPILYTLLQHKIHKYLN